MSVSFRLLTGRRVPIKVIDIGANPIDGVPPYAGMLLAGDAEVVGFEPNPEALAELHRRQGPRETYLPYAVADGQRHTLHFGHAAGMTSLFPSNPAVLNLFHGFPQWGQIRHTLEIETVRLDDIEQTAEAEFLKIDIEGGELMVFQNAENRLRDLLVIQTEVEFLPLYVGQPLFAEVDLFLRERGFMFHKFTVLNSRVVQPMLVGNDIYAGMSQVLAADAVFVRNLASLASLEDEQLLSMARIMHDCYQSLDVTFHLLIEYDRRTGDQLAAPYLRGVQADPTARQG